MAIAIAAPASGSGKTTITLALLTALQRRGYAIQSFKVGPDYIDPMFHSRATGRPCRNLDPFLTSEEYVQHSFRYHCRPAAGAIVEGVMGLFDGKAGTGDFGSTAHVARLLDLPVVLVIDAARMSHTVAAIAYGLVHYDPRLRIAGVILSRVGSERHAQLLTEAIASLDIPLLGLFDSTAEIRLPSRHLGLVPVEEQVGIDRILERLAQLAEASLNWEQLLPLILQVPTAAPSSLWPNAAPLDTSPRIAVARDSAFNFYYADNLDLLHQLGARIEEFSPLAEGLPDANDCDGLYLGGGFPELFAAALAERWQERRSSFRPPPIYAECGGLMVLGRSLTDLEGIEYPMASLLPFRVAMTKSLTLGYREATVASSTPCVRAGETVRGHEFHHSASDPPPAAPIYRWGDRRDGWFTKSMHVAYLHIHWGAQTHLARRWLQHCLAHSARCRF